MLGWKKDQNRCSYNDFGMKRARDASLKAAARGRVVCPRIDSTDVTALLCKTPDTGPSSALRPSHLDSGRAVMSTRMSPGDRSPRRPRGSEGQNDGQVNTGQRLQRGWRYASAVR